MIDIRNKLECPNCNEYAVDYEVSSAGPMMLGYIYKFICRHCGETFSYLTPYNPNDAKMSYYDAYYAWKGFLDVLNAKNPHPDSTL